MIGKHTKCSVILDYNLQFYKGYQKYICNASFLLSQLLYFVEAFKWNIHVHATC